MQSNSLPGLWRALRTLPVRVKAVVLATITVATALIGGGLVWAIPVPTTGQWVIYQSSNGGPVRLVFPEGSEAGADPDLWVWSVDQLTVK